MYFAVTVILRLVIGLLGDSGTWARGSHMQTGKHMRNVHLHRLN